MRATRGFNNGGAPAWRRVNHMTNIGELERLTDEEAADLADRLERFRAAWQTDGSTGLEPFLPPPGARHRIAVLVQLSLIDMQRRAEARLPFRAESYLESFPDDLASASALAPLLAGEHRLRHRLGDNPGLEEYQRRFPAAFDEFARKLTQPSPQPTAGPGEHTPVGVIPPQGRHLQETASDGRRRVPPSNGRIGELVVTDSVNFGSTRANRDDSTMLPTDAPYQLVRKIGSGAFGEVFEALAPGGIRVAVKRIMRSVDHPASKSEREALDSIKGLSHPFLLKTNAYWVFDDRLVIVMELADGSLSDRLEHHQHLGRPGVPPEELVPIFEQAGEALDYLHSQNVSHRDVKPENILLLQGYAKVCDFGLAHLHQHTMTEVQSTVGTPAYMAPEMWKQKVSLHSDQYALAATYVRARLGRPLFSTPVLIDLAQAHVSETPNLDPLPAAEQKVLLKALAKNPDERFASCQEFARALRAAVFPPPEPPKPPPVPTPRQGRGALWAALGVALACALAVALVNYFTQNRDDAKQQTLDNQNGKEKDKDKPPVVLPPEKQYVNYPAGWQPSPAEGAHRLGERHYHAKLTRKVGDIELVAHLLFPTNPTDPTPFYILEHKLMNKVFKALWDEAAGQEKVKQLLETKQHLLPGRWRNAEGGRELDLDGEDADLPVLGVTLPEAMIVAEWLGGRLPTHRQWLKAAGLLEGNQKDGPAGSPLQPPKLPREELLAWKREQFQKRKLALGLEAPLAIYDPRAAGDVSRWKIRQLVTNGAEWLGQSDARPESRLQLFPAPAGQQFALVVGHSASEDEIDAAGFLRNESPAAYEWDRVDGLFASFRVVLEPR